VGEIEEARIGQRLVAHYKTRLQHGSEGVHGVVSAGAAARLHHGDRERLAGVAGRAGPEAADNGLLAPELAQGSRVNLFFGAARVVSGGL
jgi:hypothetical protein